METLAGLIRQFPEGSFFIIIAGLWALEEVAKAFVNRNKPSVVKCDCACCEEDDDEEEE